jgi:hypothetical protein
MVLGAKYLSCKTNTTILISPSGKTSETLVARQRSNTVRITDYPIRQELPPHTDPLHLLAPTYITLTPKQQSPYNYT